LSPGVRLRMTVCDVKLTTGLDDERYTVTLAAGPHDVTNIATHAITANAKYPHIAMSQLIECAAEIDGEWRIDLP
jgi:hypothetical protein